MFSSKEGGKGVSSSAVEIEVHWQSDLIGVDGDLREEEYLGLAALEEELAWTELLFGTDEGFVFGILVVVGGTVYIFVGKLLFDVGKILVCDGAVLFTANRVLFTTEGVLFD